MIHPHSGDLNRVVDDVVCDIERNLLRDSLGEGGGLGDVEVKSTILLEDIHTSFLSPEVVLSSVCDSTRMVTVNIQ